MTLQIAGPSADDPESHTMPLLDHLMELRTRLLVSVIASFQVFDSTWVLTKGGPQDSTLTLVYYVYQTGFQQTRMGYASAVSYVLFGLTLIIVGVQWLSQRRWVHYQ